jgi:hypothetical protein
MAKLKKIKLSIIVWMMMKINIGLVILTSILQLLDTVICDPIHGLHQDIVEVAEHIWCVCPRPFEAGIGQVAPEYT